MALFFSRLPLVVTAGVVLLLLMHWVVSPSLFDYSWWTFFVRWIHVLAGIMWIGLLWYFNFVQIPNMGRLNDVQKSAVTQVIAPAALFWFRWAALVTVVAGLILASWNGYLVDGLTLNLMSGYADERTLNIGIGMWLGIIMFLNVWLIIWPNQQRALGMVKASAGEKAASAKRAMMASRLNTLLSIPMLYSMVAAQNVY